MQSPVRVWVGSDERGGRGEIVLAHGIKKFQPDAEVVVMAPHNLDSPHWREGWNRNRNHMRPYAGGHATNFTVFRWTIPEAAGFEGRAVYLDADQTVHADIRELAECPLDGRCCAIRKGVIVFDCGHRFWRSSEWPTIAQMKPSGWGMGDYSRRINQHGGGSALFDVAWDVLDGREMSPRKAKLNHMTDMRKQCYSPFACTFQYPLRHPNLELDMVFWESYGDALAEKAGVTRPPYKKFRNLLQWAVELEGSLGLNRWGRPVGFTYEFTEESDFLRAAKRTNPQGFRGDLQDIQPLLDRLG